MKYNTEQYNTINTAQYTIFRDNRIYCNIFNKINYSSVKYNSLYTMCFKGHFSA